MVRRSDEIIKGFIGEIGTMIDARNRTLEINLKAEIKASEDRIRRDMATKEDLRMVEERMATKDDIKNMATKDDIKNMATKDDIKRLEKKIDRSGELQRQLDELKERVKDLEENGRLHN